MGPLWEDVLMKGTKFYTAIKYACNFFCFFYIFLSHWKANTFGLVISVLKKNYF